MTKEEAANIISGYEVYGCGYCLTGDDEVEEALRMAVDALKQEPVRHGKWIYGECEIAMCDGYRCSKCGCFVPWDYGHKSIDYIKEYNYCPSCGAKMDERKEE